MKKQSALEPTSYMSYRMLADTYKKQVHLSKAEAVYRRALEAPLTSTEHDSAVTAISEFYSGEAHADKRIAVLEELSTKTEESAALYKILGDAYREAGDTEKAAPAYMKWLDIRQKAVNQEQPLQNTSKSARELLSQQKVIMPETAL